ncbi:HNH endonuclease signature motif containing protein [uncultured Cellulomonas sp.]|uniref:HNH endonuclease signature motif containing protein n=1 Tax=uncultured Cellulomonas sp. TaxID=189682 RepID=UPI002618F475|nr:DUF222 domain-containing protein [uncultured Cellulomonas sp.]
MADLVGGAATWPDGDRAELLVDLDRVIDGLGVVRARLLISRRDAQGGLDPDAAASDALRQREASTGRRTAVSQFRQAEQLEATPVVADAVTAGRVSLEHAMALAKVAATGTPAQRAALSTAGAQEALLQTAERQDPGTFATTVARWAATVDPGGLEQDHQAQRAQRYLHVTRSSAGTFLKGRLDSIAGYRLTLALEALSPRPAADDDRDPAQRRADALDAIAGRILAAADTKPGGHVPPQITMIMTPETWVAARAERDRRRGGDAASRRATGAAAAAGRPAGATVGYPPAQLEDGTPVPVTELAAAMCDCDVTRVVIDADGVAVDLGRAQRLFTGAQRRAVIARDRGCGWPGCHAPARWCEIHHIAWWDRDAGATSVDNGVLLCSYHHHETHRRDLVITRVPSARVPAEASGPSHRGAGDDGRPPAGGLVTYDVSDRTGRSVGRRATSPPDTGDQATAPPDTGLQELSPPGTGDQKASPPGTGHQATAPPDTGHQATAPPDTGGRTLSAPGTGRRMPEAPSVPRPRGGAPDAGWTTDPLTGDRVPAFLLTAWTS